jgi:6-phosphogluconolactonase
MAGKYIAYVGSYTRGKSKGITVFDVDEAFNFKKRFTYEINNPSYVQMSHDQKFLYTSCDEGVAAFRILDNGGLTFLNKASVNGLRPCYLSVDKKNQYLLAAGYHDGKMTVLKLNKDGSVSHVTDEVFMTGIGTEMGRHYMCHVNCAIFSPDERFVFSVDMGLDQVKIYEFDHKKGKLKLHGILRCEIDDGPKHMIFSNDGKYAYLTFENKNVVKQYAYDAENAKFTEMQSLSTLPKSASDYSNAVTLKITPDDKYLYVTNSGNNSVAVYKIDEQTKEMSEICILPISGEYPKDIVLMGDGQTFVCVNQISDSMTFFKMDYEKGFFTMQKKPIELYSPTTMQIKKLS